MPYVSLAQARKFHADPKLRQYAAEYDRATDFSHLPWRAPKKHRHVAVQAGVLTRNLIGGKP